MALISPILRSNISSSRKLSCCIVVSKGDTSRLDKTRMETSVSPPFIWTEVSISTVCPRGVLSVTPSISLRIACVKRSFVSHHETILGTLASQMYTPTRRGVIRATARLIDDFFDVSRNNGAERNCHTVLCKCGIHTLVQGIQQIRRGLANIPRIFCISHGLHRAQCLFGDHI